MFLPDSLLHELGIISLPKVQNGSNYLLKVPVLQNKFLGVRHELLPTQFLKFWHGVSF
jgi:hypothetical protein